MQGEKQATHGHQGRLPTGRPVHGVHGEELPLSRQMPPWKAEDGRDLRRGDLVPVLQVRHVDSDEQTAKWPRLELTSEANPVY